jgi:MFS family permease
MVESFHVSGNEVAKWAGLITASFSLGQIITALAWARASNTLGRKPVILLSLNCSFVSIILFGISPSLVWAILARSLAGISSGHVGVIRTAVAEIVPQKELQPRAFSILPLVWTTGSILGPVIGGALAYPVNRYPSVFGKDSFFEKFPFALPNLVVSIIPILGISVGSLLLRESSRDREHRQNLGSSAKATLLQLCGARERQASKRNSHEDEANLFLTPSSSSIVEMSEFASSTPTHHSSQALRYRDIFSRQSTLNLAIHTLLGMHIVTFDQFIPIFMHHPVHRLTDTKNPLAFSGGFGIGSSQIGILFTTYGIFSLIFQLAVFPPFTQRFGVLRCLKVSSLILPLVYFAIPFTSLLSNSNFQQIVMLVLMISHASCITFAYPCSIILLTNSAPTLKILEALNGFVTIFSALGKTIGPALGGAIFMAGVDTGYILIPWWTLGIVAMLAAILVFWLVEMESLSEDNRCGESINASGGDGMMPQ